MKKKLSRVICMLLCVIIICAMMPTTASAEINNAELAVDTTLTINGSLVNDSLLRTGADCEVTGQENISTGEYGNIWQMEGFTNYTQLKECLALAETHPEYIYEIYYANYLTEWIDIHVSENLTIPENVVLNVEDHLILTVDAGCTLINKGYIVLHGGKMIIKGTLDNSCYIQLGWVCHGGADYRYGFLNIAPTGTYTGDGYIGVVGGKRTNYHGFFLGLDFTQFNVYTDDSTGGYYWDFIPKSVDGIDPGDTVGGFTDVSVEDYYSEPVMWAVEMGITNGYGSFTTFCPDLECTRGQVVTFLWRAAGEPEPTSIDNPFTDVASDAYYYKAVLWAVENGITAGYGSDTIFNPDGVCNRAQVATFLWRAAGEPSMASATNPFTDVASDAYYYDAVLWAVENGITKGYGSDTIFNPDGNCTRGQIVTFLYRAFGN